MLRRALPLFLLLALAGRTFAQAPAQLILTPPSPLQTLQMPDGGGGVVPLGVVDPTSHLWTPFCAALPCGTGGGGSFVAPLTLNGASGLTTTFLTSAGVGASATSLSTGLVANDYAVGNFFALPYAGDSVSSLTAPSVVATFINGPVIPALGPFKAGDTSVTMSGPAPVQSSPPGVNNYTINGAALVDIENGCQVGTISSWSGNSNVLSLTSGAACDSVSGNDLLAVQQSGYGQTTVAVGPMSGGIIPVLSGPPTQASFPVGAVVQVHDLGPTRAVDNVVGQFSSWAISASVHGTIEGSATTDTGNCPGDTGGQCFHVTSVVSGAIALGDFLSDNNDVILGGTSIQSMLSAGGGTGYYLLNQAATDPAEHPSGYKNPAAISVGGKVTVSSPSGTVSGGDLIAFTTSYTYFLRSLDRAHFPDAAGGWSCCGVSSTLGVSNTLTNVPAILGPQQFVNLAVTPGDIGGSQTATWAAGATTITLTGGTCPLHIAFDEAIYDSAAVAYVGRVLSCAGGVVTLQDGALVASVGTDALKFRLPFTIYKSLGGVVPYWVNSGWIDWVDGFASPYNDAGYCHNGSACPTASRPITINACASDGVNAPACPGGNSNFNDWALRHVDSVVTLTNTINFSPAAVNSSNGARTIYHHDAEAFAATIGAGNVTVTVPPGGYNLFRSIVPKTQTGIACGDGSTLNPIGATDGFDVTGQAGALISGGGIDKCTLAGKDQTVGWAVNEGYVNKDWKISRLVADAGYNGIVMNQFTNIATEDVTFTNLTGEPLRGYVVTGQNSAWGQITTYGRTYVGGQAGATWGNRSPAGVGFDINGGLATVAITNAQAERIPGAGGRISNAAGAANPPLGPYLTAFMSEFSISNALQILDGQKINVVGPILRASMTDNFESCPLSANLLDAAAATNNFLNVSGGRNEGGPGDGAFLNGSRTSIIGQQIFRNSSFNRTTSQQNMIGPGGTHGVCSGIHGGALALNNQIGLNIIGQPIAGIYQLAPVVLDSGATGNGVSGNQFIHHVTNNNHVIDNSGNATNLISCNVGSDANAGAGDCPHQ